MNSFYSRILLSEDLVFSLFRVLLTLLIGLLEVESIGVSL